MKRIAIIGFGRFGQCICQLMVDHSNVEILVVSSHSSHHPSDQVKFVQIEDIRNADIVIPAVPISHFEETIKKISPFLKSEAVVIDVCSVKVFPVEVMTKYLPASVEIVASHPIFGPDSVQKNQGVHGLPIVLFPVRCSVQRFEKIKEFCQKIKLKVTEMTPEEHDQFAAYTQAYAFLIGKIGQRMDLKQTPIDTWWYSLLREQCSVVERDTEQLFLDIQTKNPYAAEMRTEFKKVIQSLFTQIEQHKA